MDLFLNTSNPIVILCMFAGIVAVIWSSRKAETALPVAIFMAFVLGVLVFHTVALDQLQKGSEEIKVVYHCIACDLLNLLVLFISYLWIDSIIAKNKKLKSYDDSLNWFWDKL